MLAFYACYVHTKFDVPFYGVIGMKKILSVLFLILPFFVLVQSVHAQTSLSTPLPPQQTSIKTVYPLNTDANVPQNFHTYSQNVFIEILTNISCLLTGYDPLNPDGQCLGIDTTTHKIGYVEGGGGAIGVVGNMISMTFNIPVSSTAYVRDMAENFGITKTGYAAAIVGGDAGGGTQENASLGYGYTGLKPVLAIWKVFRNLIYLFLVLLFIMIGLGIMFRINIDARSVMTIQNQLPKIVIGIILVTFSYAIAGFIVDMMYVFMYLIYYVFTQQALSIDVSGLNPSYLQGTSPLGAIGGIGGASDIAFGAAQPLGHILASLFDNTFGKIIATIIGGIIGGGAGAMTGNPIVGAIGGVVGLAVGAFAGSKLLGVVGGLIAYIVITVAVIWSMLRLWFLLLRSYLFFLVDVIIAPFWIGVGLIPKAGTAGFGSWIRDIIANLAVFPATLFILLLGKVLVTQFSSNANSHSFVPPLIGNPGDVGNFGAIIGLGIILLLPGVVTMVRDTLKAPGFKYTQVIGQSLGAGTGFAQAARKKVQSSLWYTDPHTGAAGRLKAFAGQRANRALDRIPGVNKGVQKLREIFPKNPLSAKAQQAAKIAELSDNIGSSLPEPTPLPTKSAFNPYTDPADEAALQSKARDIAIQSKRITDLADYDKLDKDVKEALRRVADRHIRIERGIPPTPKP
jgi:hypothetical protein